MTKTIVIGDLHGRDIWRNIVEKEKDATKFIFMGDYWDSFDVPFVEQVENWTNLVTFKASNPDKVVLLIGNHDFHYMWFAKEQYSGYQHIHEMVIRDYLKQASNLGLMQTAYQQDKYLFTHAGVTKTWFENSKIPLISRNEKNEIQVDSIANGINYIWEDHPEAFRFTPSTGLDNTGDSTTQSPIWVRPRALQDDMIEGFTQVVGHTHTPSIVHFQAGDRHLILTDTFDHCKEYLSIEDGISHTRSL